MNLLFRRKKWYKTVIQEENSYTSVILSKNAHICVPIQNSYTNVIQLFIYNKKSRLSYKFHTVIQVFNCYKIIKLLLKLKFLVFKINKKYKKIISYTDGNF